MNYFIIYAIGFVITWIVFKYLIRGSEPENNQWKDIMITFIISIFSWIGLILLCVIWFMFYFKNNDTLLKPPKWL